MEEMEGYEKPQCHFCKGFLIGGALGVLAGILFAPKSGKELRSDIREKGSEVLEEARHQAKELKQEADRHLSEARQKAKEIFTCGEKKEAETDEEGKGRIGKKKV